MKKVKSKTSIFKNLNKPLLILTLLYAIGGAFLILDASSISSVLVYGQSSAFYYFKLQLIFVVVSLLASIIFILNINTKKYYKKLSYFSMLALTGWIGFQFIKGKVFSSGINTVTIDFLNFNFQFAEMIKVFFVLYLGTFYYAWQKNENHPKWSFLFPVGLCALSVLFVALEGDLGTAAVMTAIVAIVFIFIPTKEKMFRIFKIIAVSGLSLVVLLLMYGYKIIPEDKLKEDNRLTRLIYTEPCTRYIEQTGYQVCNGYIAIHNGGLLGVGIGKSTQKYLYLPESHTDFIFPIIVEELGCIAGILILIGYGAMIFIIFKISSKCYDLQSSIICFGIGIYFLLQIVVNLTGVLGIIPLTGIPLPFLSYGGSSCVTAIAAMFIVQRINIENNEEKIRREIKKITN